MEFVLRHQFVTFMNSAGVVQRLDDQEEGKTKQRVSYETFVQSLEESDSFATSLIEILVKVRKQEQLICDSLIHPHTGARRPPNPSQYSRP